VCTCLFLQIFRVDQTVHMHRVHAPYMRYDRTLNNFPATNTGYTPYIHGSSQPYKESCACYCSLSFTCRNLMATVSSLEELSQFSLPQLQVREVVVCVWACVWVLV